MTGQLPNQHQPEGTATPEDMIREEFAQAIRDGDLAMAVLRNDIRGVLLAYREASDAQAKLLNHLERVVRWSTGQVNNG